MENELELIKKNWFKTSSIYSKMGDSFGIDSFKLKILNIIVLLKENCTQKRIVELTNVPKQSINNVIQDFATEGYVVLNVDKKDKRTKLITLTQKGLNLCEKSIFKIIELEQRVLSKFSEEETEQFINLYTKYNDLLEKEAMEKKQ